MPLCRARYFIKQVLSQGFRSCHKQDRVLVHLLIREQVVCEGRYDKIVQGSVSEPSGKCRVHISIGCVRRLDGNIESDLIVTMELLLHFASVYCRVFDAVSWQGLQLITIINGGDLALARRNIKIWSLLQFGTYRSHQLDLWRWATCEG